MPHSSDYVKASSSPDAEVSPAGEFRLLADSIPHLAWIADPDGNVSWYNQRFYEYTGLTHDQLKGWGWQSIHDPQLLPAVITRWHESLRRGLPFEMTFPLRRADGQYRQFLTRANPLKNSAGEVIRWFGTNTDISEHLATVTALRNSEQRFRTAAEAVSGLLWTNDPDGRMVGEQPAWTAFTGQTYEQYNGYGWSSSVHPDDVEPTIRAWEESVRETKLFSFEHRVRRRDGVYRLFRIRALPATNPDGTVREWVGVHTDITEERAAQEALRDTIAELRRQKELVEAAQLSNNVGFWRLTPSTGDIFLSAGSLRLHGFPIHSQPSLEDCLERIFPEDRAGLEAATREAMHTGHYIHEFRLAPGSGAPVRCIRGIARVLEPPGEPPYLVGLNLDITDQKLSADALIRTEKLAIAGRLAASIAHEINNPLEAVTNLLYLLSHTELDQEQRSYCDTMDAELQRVSAMATHTLRFHRQSTRAAHTSIDSLIDSVLALFKGRIRNLSIEIVRRSLGGPSVFGFDGELRQVLANLINNAIDALSFTSGTRVLSLRTSAGHDPRSGAQGIAILIADNGPGIPESSLAHIFDPFFTTKGEFGTGLGLWVSSDIVHKHRGTIRVRSSQGEHIHGATFRIFLPSNADDDDVSSEHLTDSF